MTDIGETTCCNRCGHTIEGRMSVTLYAYSMVNQSNETIARTACAACSSDTFKHPALGVPNGSFVGRLHCRVSQPTNHILFRSCPMTWLLRLHPSRGRTSLKSILLHSRLKTGFMIRTRNYRTERGSQNLHRSPHTPTGRLWYALRFLVASSRSYSKQTVTAGIRMLPTLPVETPAAYSTATEHSDTVTWIYLRC